VLAGVRVEIEVKVSDRGPREAPERRIRL